MSKSEVPTEREWLEGIHPDDPRLPDNTQELDPIINIMDMWDFSPLQDEDTRRERVYKEIQAHTNAEIARVLDRLEQADAKLTDGRHLELDIPSWVKAERNKLKGG